MWIMYVLAPLSSAPVLSKEAPELHHSDRHLRGLAGADAVKQPDGGLGDDPGDGGPLVRLRGEGAGQPGECQLRAGGGVVAQDEAVESAVVRGEQASGA